MKDVLLVGKHVRSSLLQSDAWLPTCFIARKQADVHSIGLVEAFKHADGDVAGRYCPAPQSR